jgi:hypothetical protein
MTRHPGRRGLAAGALASAMLAAVPGRTQARVQIVAERLPQPPAAERVSGRLAYRGGVALSSRDPRFGGWSDLWISPDGGKLVMLSDAGWFLDARPSLDADGVPTAIESARFAPLPLPNDPQLRRRPDAEGLAPAADGGFLVSFEHTHSIWYYAAGGPAFAQPPAFVPSPRGIEAAPRNGGMEALAAWPDGTMAVLAEELVDARGDHRGWMDGPALWTPFTLAASGFNPTGACVSPEGDLLVLGRRFAFFTFSARVSRLTRAQCLGGGRLVDAELAQWYQPDLMDNFEGIAARRGARGETLIYLVSDDNFRRTLQRTLLLCFELTG